MILVLEIGCLIWGFFILVTGRISLASGRAVAGWPARLAGLFVAAPLPVAFAAGYTYGRLLNARGGPIDMEGVKATTALIEVAILVVCFGTAGLIVWINTRTDAARPPRRKTEPAPEEPDARADQPEVPVAAVAVPAVTVFSCPSCSKRLSMSATLQGQRCRCPGCGTEFVTPVSKPPVAVTVEPPRPAPAVPARPPFPTSAPADPPVSRSSSAAIWTGTVAGVAALTLLGGMSWLVVSTPDEGKSGDRNKKASDGPRVKRDDNAGRDSSRNKVERSEPTQLHDSDYRAVCFSPAGDHAVTMSRRGQLCRWNLKGEKVLQSSNPPTLGEDGHRILNTPDGKALLVEFGGSAGSRTRIYDAATLTLQGGEFQGARIALSPDGKSVAAITGDSTMMVHDFATRQQKHRIERPEWSAVDFVAFSSDGQFLAVAVSERFQVRAVASFFLLPFPLLQPRDALRMEESHSGIALSPDGTTVATIEPDQAIRLYDLKTKKVRHILREPRLSMQVLAFSPVGHELVGFSGGKLHFWDYQTGQKRGSAVHVVDPNGLTSLAYSPDGAKLAVASRGKLNVIDTRTLDTNR